MSTSYATTFEQYLKGHVVSSFNARIIKNMMMATASQDNNDEDSESNSSEEDTAEYKDSSPVGNLTVVRNMLQGIGKRSSENESKGLSRHAKTIRLGTSLWQSEPLTMREAADVRETTFSGNLFPTVKQSKQLLENLNKNKSEPLAPFESKTQGSARLK